MPDEVTQQDVERLAGALRDLLHAQEPGPLARRLCEAVREVVGADGATLVLREEDRVYYAEEDAPDGLWKGRRFPVTDCISGWAIVHRATAVIEDVYGDPRIPVEAYRPTFVRSLVSTPIDRDEPIGALGAYWRTTRVATRREVWLLERLADAAAGAIRNSLAHVAKAQQASRASDDGLMSRLLAVVAHDLRQPLSTITYAAAELLDEAEARGRDTDVLRRLERSAGQASRLIAQLLDLAATARGGLELQVERIRLDELCRTVCDDIDLPADRLQVEATPIEALIDADRVRQVVINLVRNALQHGEPGRPVTLRLARRDDLAHIEVHNHGRPIPEDDVPMLFQPFQRLAAERRVGSAGLGLYIAHQIVRAHGGNIEVESTRGKGTRFVVTFPLGATMRPHG